MCRKNRTASIREAACSPREGRERQLRKLVIAPCPPGGDSGGCHRLSQKQRPGVPQRTAVFVFMALRRPSWIGGRGALQSPLVPAAQHKRGKVPKAVSRSGFAAAHLLKKAVWELVQLQVFGDARRASLVMPRGMEGTSGIPTGAKGARVHFVSSSNTETTYSAMAQSCSSVPPPTPIPPAIFPFTNSG